MYLTKFISGINSLIPSDADGLKGVSGGRGTLSRVPEPLAARLLPEGLVVVRMERTE